MEVHLTAELEAKIARLAGEAGQEPGQLVGDLLERYLDHDAWFRQQVQRGLEEAERGELVEHHEVVARIERRLAIHGSPRRS